MEYNFVIISLSPWNINYGCNIKDMSLELAKHHKVLYIDTPLKRKERWFMKDQPLVKEAIERHSAGQSLIKISENLWHYIPEEVLESVNSLTIDFLFDQLNYINNSRFARAIQKAVAKVGFDKYILINDNDIYNGLHLKKMLSPQRYVYYLRDKLSSFSYWKRHVTRLEPKLLREADLIVTNSEYLSAYAGEYNKESYYVGQGCDVEHYLKRPPQEDIDKVLSSIPRPIVGYVGAINAERLDIELLQQMALKMPNTSFVLVGAEDEVFKSSSLHDLKNIYFLGKKEISDLPTYIYGFDVCINPQRLNEITIGNYPRKIDEYLATGLPVVATKTHTMNTFRDHVYLAEGVEEYCASIKLAITEDSNIKSKNRISFACTHTWANNIAEIVSALDKTKF